MLTNHNLILFDLLASAEAEQACKKLCLEVNATCIIGGYSQVSSHELLFNAV